MIMILLKKCPYRQPLVLLADKLMTGFPPQEDAEDQTASDLAVVLFETATLRSGYQLADTKAYGERIERMLRLSMNVPLDEQASRSCL